MSLSVRDRHFNPTVQIECYRSVTAPNDDQCELCCGRPSNGAYWNRTAFLSTGSPQTRLAAALIKARLKVGLHVCQPLSRYLCRLCRRRGVYGFGRRTLTVSRV